MPTDKTPFTLRLDEDLLQQLRAIAVKEKRSVNNLIEYFLMHSLEWYNKS